MLWSHDVWCACLSKSALMSQTCRTQDRWIKIRKTESLSLHVTKLKILRNIITFSCFVTVCTSTYQAISSSSRVFALFTCRNRYLYGPLSKSRVPDPFAVQKVIDRGYRETCDMSRKILYTRLVPANVVASKVNAQSSRISSFRIECSENVGTQNFLVRPSAVSP